MARSILSKSSSKLNLSRRQTEIFQKTLLAGGHMAQVLRNHKQEAIPVEEASKLAGHWGDLMVELAKLLL